MSRPVARKTRRPQIPLPRLRQGIYDLLKSLLPRHALTARALAKALRATKDNRYSRVSEDTVRAAIKQMRDRDHIPIKHVPGAGYHLEPDE